MGNLRSVARALEAAGATVDISGSAPSLDSCDGLCVPGQGIFERCMANLASSELDGLVRRWVAGDRPYLGICLGMQILYEASEEGGERAGLGVFGGRATRLPSSVLVPHIGWNTVNGEHYYFDHSFAVHPADETAVTGWCEHGERFAALVEMGSVTATQFHPEKSGPAGIELLKGWVSQG